MVRPGAAFVDLAAHERDGPPADLNGIPTIRISDAYPPKRQESVIDRNCDMSVQLSRSLWHLPRPAGRQYTVPVGFVTLAAGSEGLRSERNEWAESKENGHYCCRSSGRN